MTTSVIKVNFSGAGYKNWLKVSMALQFTTKAMTPFCVDVIGSFHTSLKTSIGSSVCSAGCTNEDIKKKKKKFTCGSNVCDKWLAAIEAEQATRQYSVDNTTVALWPVHPWQIAQYYMGPGQDATNTSPSQTDPGGKLQLAINCKQFHQLINIDKIKAVRTTRNVVMHSAHFNFAAADMKTHLQCMEDLLQESALQKYTAAKRAVFEIKLIENADIDISDAAVLQHERSIWKQLIVDQTASHKDILKIIASNKDLQKRLGDVYTKLKTEVDNVRRDVDDIKRNVDDVRRDVGDVRRDVEDVRDQLQETKVTVHEAKEQVRELVDGKQKSETERKAIAASVKEQLQAKYRDLEKHDDKFVQLHLQNSQQLEVLPDTLTDRDVKKLEILRRSSPVVPLKQLFSKLEDQEIAPKKVLICGRAGVGKTTLVEYIAREWAVLKLWPHFDYVFVVKLREFSKDKWSLSDLLLDGLTLKENDERAAFKEICQNFKGVLFLFDGGDELAGGVGHSKERFPIEEKVVMSRMIYCVINCKRFHDASVVITTRPTNQIPSKPFDDVVDVYGFTKDGIKRYVDKFCTGKLREFIQTNIDSNPNMATFCHTPVQCVFICKTLADMFERSESGSVPDIRTMTQLYVKATYRLGRKLHPSLKGDERDLDLEQIFRILKEPFLKHATLAKDNMTHPLKIIFYDNDLRQHLFKDEDKQTGFLSGSKKMDPDDREIRRNTWSFSHLSLQEFFAAVGLIQGPRTDVWELLEGSVKQNEIVITFLCGLLGDPRNVYYLKHLGSTDGLLDFCKEFIEKLKGELDDAFKLAQFIYETQCTDFVDNVPEEIKTSKIYPMEMLAMCWVMAQDTCRVTSLDLSRCELDIPLVKQLCEALQHNKTIQKLNLSRCDLNIPLVKQLCEALQHNKTIQKLNLGFNGVFAEEEAGRMLGAALASMEQLCGLSVRWCDLSKESLQHVLDGLSRGCPRLTSLDLSLNGVFAEEEAGRTLGAALASMEQLSELRVWECRLSKESLPHVLDGLERCPRLTSLDLGWNEVFAEEEAGRTLGAALASMEQLSKLNLSFCDLTDESFKHIVDGICRGPGCQQLKTLHCQYNYVLTSAVIEETVRGLLTERPHLKIWVVGCGLSDESKTRLKKEFPGRFHLDF